MATENQIAANRQNAQKSTGPVSPEGKAAVGRNALKHGLRAVSVVLPGESREEFEQYRDELVSNLQPEGAIEAMLVDHIAAGFWRLQRAGRIERQLMAHLLHLDEARTAIREHNSSGYSKLPVLGPNLAREFINTRSFDCLQRYESQLDRQFFRALHELERLRARRLGEAVPPPAVVDVSVHPDPAHLAPVNNPRPIHDPYE